MKKIPTLFKRVFSPDHKTKTILPEVTPGCEAVLEGRCIPTVKWDGACCAIINGEIWKRYDAKHGKKPPEGAIRCQPEPDPITTHWPHWVKCVEGNPSDKYFLEAFENTSKSIIGLGWHHDGFITEDGLMKDCTLEAVGPSWQSNPYGLKCNLLFPHGWRICSESGSICANGGKLSFQSIRECLSHSPIEGIVFWEPLWEKWKAEDKAYDMIQKSQPLCKIKRSDFGFEWPVKSK